jgi:hypothetical protein
VCDAALLQCSTADGHLERVDDEFGAVVVGHRIADLLTGCEMDVGQGSDRNWVVMADPEGNEFCVLRTLAP